LYVVGMVLANLVIIWLTVQILRNRAKVERKRVAEPGPIAAPQNPSVSSTSS